MKIAGRRSEYAAALFAGAIAGVVATLAQVALWSAFTPSPMALLVRDARFAAAIIDGGEILTQSAVLDWRTLAIATLVHFALSLTYGVVIYWLVSRLRPAAAAVAGAAFGLGLYGINMYGLTVFFPWFVATRDWITITAHLTFGVTAATAYKAMSKG